MSENIENGKTEFVYFMRINKNGKVKSLEKTNKFSPDEVKAKIEKYNNEIKDDEFKYILLTTENEIKLAEYKVSLLNAYQKDADDFMDSLDELSKYAMELRNEIQTLKKENNDDED